MGVSDFSVVHTGFVMRQHGELSALDQTIDWVCVNVAKITRSELGT